MPPTFRSAVSGSTSTASLHPDASYPNVCRLRHLRRVHRPLRRPQIRPPRCDCRFGAGSVAAPLLAHHRAPVVPRHRGGDGAAVFARADPHPAGSNADRDVIPIPIIAVAIAVTIRLDLHVLRHLKPRCAHRCAHRRSIDGRRSGQAESRAVTAASRIVLIGDSFPSERASAYQPASRRKVPAPAGSACKVSSISSAAGLGTAFGNGVKRAASAIRCPASAPSLQLASTPW